MKPLFVIYAYLSVFSHAQLPDIYTYASCLSPSVLYFYLTWKVDLSEWSASGASQLSHYTYFGYYYARQVEELYDMSLGPSEAKLNVTGFCKLS